MERQIYVGESLRDSLSPNSELSLSVCKDQVSSSMSLTLSVRREVFIETPDFGESGLAE